MSDKYSVEVNNKGFCYLIEAGKKIATLFGTGEVKEKRGLLIADLLNQYERGEIHPSEEIQPK